MWEPSCPHPTEGAAQMSETTETAILAGGCFWGVQDLVRKLPGVITTRVGYTGDDGHANATYPPSGMLSEPAATDEYAHEPDVPSDHQRPQ